MQTSHGRMLAIRLSTWLVLLLLFSVGVWLIHYFSTLNRDDVVGNASGGSATCDLRDLFTVPSGNGLEATVREAGCRAALAQGALYYVVFVHEPGEKNTTENMVFEYEPSFGFFDGKVAPPPKLTWTDASTLSISASGIQRIRTQKRKLGNVVISYSR
jgi:hypothetical protein